MLPQSISFPFSIPNVYQSLAEARGIIRTNKDGLILEFEVKDAFVGMLKSGINEVPITIDELSYIGLKTGWFRTTLFIRTKSMATVSTIPGNEAGQITLRIARKDITIAKGLVSALMYSLAEKELEQLS